MKNNFEEKRKDIDMSNIDIDSQIFQRKKLELDYNYQQKKDTEEEFCSKERDLANNNDDEMLRRILLRKIASDYEQRMNRLNTEYQKELKELEEKYEPKYEKPLYFKWRYIGPVGKYERLICGLTYYVKLDEFDKLTVYNDVKFSKLMAEIHYFKEEWLEVE